MDAGEPLTLDHIVQMANVWMSWVLHHLRESGEDFDIVVSIRNCKDNQGCVVSSSTDPEQCTETLLGALQVVSEPGEPEQTVH